MKKRLICLLLALFWLSSHAEMSTGGAQSDLATTSDTESSVGSDAIGQFVADAISTVVNIVDDLSQITCESATMLNFVKGSLQNTCTPIPLLSFLLESFITPNSFAGMMRLSMNNPELLGYDNCSYFNRASYYSPSVSFGVCLDVTLLQNIVGAPLVDAGQAMIDAINGKKADKIQSAFGANMKLKPEDMYSTEQAPSQKNPYYFTLEISKGKQMSEGILLFDTSPIPMNFALKRQDDKVCVVMDDVYFQTPIGCKYTKDPYQFSKYAPFQGENSQFISDAISLSNENNMAYSALQSASVNDLQCNNLSSCYYSAVDASKTLLPISSPLVNCIGSMLNNVVGSSTVCASSGVKDINSSIKSQTSAFYSLQSMMKKSVTALLILYVMFAGVQIALGSGKLTNPSEIIMFCIKLILVTYFSIGINLSGTGTNYSGMIDWIFPMFLGGLNQIASWIVGSSPSGLCSFTASDYTGTSYALWDALDCRVATYIGISGFTDLFTSLRDSGQYVGSAADSLIYTNLGTKNYSVPPYMLLLLPALYMGNLYLVSLALAFPILVISIAAYVVQLSIISMIYIAVLGILAPIFVPMALFEYTKGYFETWMRMFFSFLLQPAVAVTFTVILFSIYDYGFYGDCQYQPLYVKMPDGNILKSFYLDVNSSDIGNCQKTLGWWMSEKFDFSKASQTNGIPTVTLLELNNGGYASAVNTVVEGAKTIAVDAGKAITSVADGLTFSSGNFFNIATAPLKDFFQLCMSMMTACFTIYIGYQLSEQLSQFAADLTGGISVESMISNVKKNFDNISKPVQFLVKKGLESRGKLNPSRMKGASDMFKMSEKSEAKDTVSRYSESSEEAKDNVVSRYSQSSSGTSENALDSVSSPSRIDTPSAQDETSLTSKSAVPEGEVSKNSDDLGREDTVSSRSSYSQSSISNSENSLDSVSSPRRTDIPPASDKTNLIDKGPGSEGGEE